MEEGSLDPAPVFSDARSFDGTQFRGRVRGVIAGTPCQDLSIAGQQAGLDGERSKLFYEFHRVVEEAQPDWAFWENVGNATQALPTVGAEFASIGYRGAWCSIRASDVGGRHRRRRVFALFVADAAGIAKREPDNEGRPKPRQRTRQGVGRRGLRHGAPPVGNLCGAGLEECGPLRSPLGEGEGETAERAGLALGEDPPGPDDLAIWSRLLRASPHLAPAAPEPLVQCVVDAMGLADRQDVLRLIGNGVYPLQAATGFRLLWNHLVGE
jgi:DNA (cytosine-5)-methyltransferase 1